MHKASHVLIRQVPSEVVSLYENAHKLASLVTDTLLAMYQTPYLLRTDKGERQVTQEEIDARLVREFGELTPEKRTYLKSFVDGILVRIEGFAKSENSVALLFAEDTEARPHKRKEYRLVKTAQEEKWDWEKFKKTLEETKIEAVFTDDEWKSYLNGSLDKFGQDLLIRSCPVPRAAANALRDMGSLPVVYDDFPYHRQTFNAIMFAVAQRIKQWTTASDKCSIRKQELKYDFEKKKDLAGEEYDLFCEFAADLAEIDYGVTKKLVLSLSSGKYLENFAPAVQILNTEKYEPLKKKFFKLGNAYLAQQKYTFAKSQAAFCEFSAEHSPFPLRFGQTGRGHKFSMANVDGKLGFTLHVKDSKVGVSCVPSRYFDSPKVTAREDGNYDIEFTRIGNGNPRFVSIVKEIALMKKKNKFYFSVNFEMDPVLVDKTVNKARTYFNSALSTTQPIPEGELTVMSVDLGMTPAFAYAITKLGNKDGVISCPVAGLEDVKFSKTGLCGGIIKQSLYSKIRALAQQCYYGPKYMSITKKIRDGKTVNAIQKKLYDEVFTPGFGISQGSTENEQYKLLGKKVSDLVKEFRLISSDFAKRDTPEVRAKNKHWEPICAEAFQMLILLQNIKSLLKSWSRYHLKSGQMVEGNSNELASYNRHYQNLRLDTLRKMTSQIVKIAVANNVNIVVFEKLEIQDRDDEVRSSRDNNIRSIWSPNQLLTKLEEELLNHGILKAEVDPRHTSQLSVVTDEFGKRLKNRKEYFYYKHNNQIVRMQSDLNAAMNIARRFLTRYATLSQLVGKELPDGRSLILEGGKQQQSFLNSSCNSNFALLNLDGSLEGLPKKRHTELLKTASEKYTKYYRHESKWISRDAHFQMMSVLDRQVYELGDGNIPKIEP